MTVTAPPAADRPNLGKSGLSARRRLTDLVMRVAMALALVIAVIPLGLVVYAVIARGGSVLSLEFFTEDIPFSYRRAGGGMAPAIVGTLVITGGAALLAIPLGVLGAIYLNEYGGQHRLARTIRMMADVMTGVPSIVMGLFIYVTWVTTFQSQSGFAAALALACLMLPIVIRTTEEMLKLVPDELRQASLALGARKWRTILTVVLPAAISGITSGSLLAVARAAGETAPLVVTAGVVYSANWSLAGSNTALPAQIFRNASQPFVPAQERAWGAALTLVAIVLVFTAVARMISSRFAIKGH
ncbi:MAG: phosphate ABC transporter permease PstA [Micromonosporaceae bacterium]